MTIDTIIENLKSDKHYIVDISDVATGQDILKNVGEKEIIEKGKNVDAIFQEL
ncbi:MAG: hypothetical protein HRT68_15795, partial [Flavobacteriaceae bacterium]|nr:hypothetical protein [Flavobacteriaceae bacterium]